MMCRRSFSRPGFAGFPSSVHFLRESPPFHTFVVKPRISTFTPQRSSVCARMSVQSAAVVIGTPRIEPELSTRRVTTVSGNSGLAFAFERQRPMRAGDDARQPPGVEDAFFLIEHPRAILLRE